MTQLKSPPKAQYQIPKHLLQPMWLRSRESMVDGGLVFDPIAANACRRCHLAPDCLAGDIDQQQLLHASLTQLCDDAVRNFLHRHPDAWVLNVGAGLDTRFYRLDNGRCHWLELDISENLLWRQRLFHPSERYQLRCGSVTQTEWLDELAIPEDAPVLIVSDHALLNCSESEIGKFMCMLARRFIHAQSCFVVAGDKTQSWLGKKLGTTEYQYGFANPAERFGKWLPWSQWIKVQSPVEGHCMRWKMWQRWLAKMPTSHSYTPLVLQMRW
ncbi:class I SAM-dependent methyltransferase [Vibrio tapetis]|uniref:Putative Polyketide synthesis O-methyltransferase, TcmP n=1 Tax=Vibrio tapetis subsp. tapetis TaxID=1671868 RepID=A0A2N8ZHK5_9VIBR|nr:class I SAM-dependent methyltransferase [Vibrio tapetis]SON51380.1 putative Polyketide synthesis O-methyltransferase, TcmP [Vibrio tapetis subsp. tapetis]